MDQVSVPPRRLPVSTRRPSSAGKHSIPPLVFILPLLTFAVFLIHGYHPLADDGAIYVEGVQKLIHPGLYRVDSVFVTQHVRFSIFAHALAWIAKGTHLSLPVLLLLCQLFSILLFLLACWRVATGIFRSSCEQWSAVLLAACCFTLPVAGTSLFLMDPYVTARSFSTPLNLFALAAGIRGSWRRAAVWLLAAGLFHPLMAGFAAIYLIVYALTGKRREKNRWTGPALLFGAGFLLSAVLFFATRHAPDDVASAQAALSRSYFFLSGWQWYEYLGLVLPLLLFLIAAQRCPEGSIPQRLAMAAFTIGCCATLVALCFVHRSGSFLLARLQVLRSFHMIYLAGILLLGGLLGGLLARRRIRLAAALSALLYLGVASAMFAAQCLTYPASNHVEWPDSSPRNLWQQAFLWVRANTPKDSVFALDADYIEFPGEDAQSFRATAQRSTIADWYKDGGIASMFPAAQRQWWNEVQATEGLNHEGDAQRIAKLAPFGVGWIVLPASASTQLSCPYSNHAVRVCSLSVR